MFLERSQCKLQWTPAVHFNEVLDILKQKERMVCLTGPNGLVWSHSQEGKLSVSLKDPLQKRRPHVAHISALILHVSCMLATCVLHAGYMCPACWLHVCCMLATCVLHAGYTCAAH